MSKDTAQSAKKVFRSVEEYRKAYFPEEDKGLVLSVDDPARSGERLAQEAVRRFLKVGRRSQ